MRLKVFGSGSRGNCYLIYNDKEALMLEAGIDFRQVIRFLKGDISRIKGCLVTHEHGDHARYVKDVLDRGKRVFMTEGTRSAFLDANAKRRLLMKPNAVKIGTQFKAGAFTILPFETVHDAAEPCGYLIHHKEMGSVLFATDTSYIPNTFGSLSNILIECNYDEDMLMERTDIPEDTKERIKQSHMGVDDCIGVLNANDLTMVNNIVLIHISEGSGSATDFCIKVARETRSSVLFAKAGLDIDFGKTPF